MSDQNCHLCNQRTGMYGHYAQDENGSYYTCQDPIRHQLHRAQQQFKQDQRDFQTYLRLKQKFDPNCQCSVPTVTTQQQHGTIESVDAGCRCDDCKDLLVHDQQCRWQCRISLGTSPGSKFWVCSHDNYRTEHPHGYCDGGCCR